MHVNRKRMSDTAAALAELQARLDAAASEGGRLEEGLYLDLSRLLGGLHAKAVRTVPPKGGGVAAMFAAQPRRDVGAEHQ